MKVAVLYTGALRTIRKTMRYFKQNVLLHDDVHVFACLQNDTSLLASQQEDWIRDTIGEHLISIEWFSLSSHQHWVQHRNHLLNNMNIHDKTRDYLKTSGSMIEYYQLQLAYIAMTKYEKNWKYDYIIRVRPDTIFAKPIDFHWLHWSESDVEMRLERIRQELVESNIESDPIPYFMNTIISDTLIPNCYHLIGTLCLPNQSNPISNLHEYIKKGAYILTLRKNLLYIVRRDLFHLIPSLGTMYGTFHQKTHSYWWDSESQFEAACYHSNITIYNYSTEFDDRSLYEYDEKRYFDRQFSILNPAMLYCLVRH